MNITIDPNSGFCAGVKKAIHLAESTANKEGKIHVLGQLIHNKIETSRLAEIGIETVDLDTVKNGGFDKILLRAHGEPPSTYQLAKDNEVQIIDGTCKVVQNSQNLAAEFDKKGYQVVIIGKKGHPEVVGICGNCDTPAIVISKQEDIADIPKGKKIFLLVQTTFSEDTYHQLRHEIKKKHYGVVSKNTICKFISKRNTQIKKFAAENELVLMVGGKNSSNTKILFEVSRSENKNTHWIEHPDEINAEWLNDVKTIGITGSASTPPWLIDLTESQILKIIDN